MGPVGGEQYLLMAARMTGGRKVENKRLKIDKVRFGPFATRR